LKFEGLFDKEFKAIKTPMSEGYHPECYGLIPEIRYIVQSLGVSLDLASLLLVNDMCKVLNAIVP
jgi:hypothetical protein